VNPIQNQINTKTNSKISLWEPFAPSAFYCLVVNLSLFLISSCSAIETSSYTPSKEPETKTESAKIVEAPDAVDMLLGLPSCVKTYLGDQNQSISEPPEITSDLQSFGEEQEITTLADLTDLTDLLFREISTPSKGLIDYAILKGKRKAVWLLLLSGLEAIEPPTGTDSDKISYWVNAYNIFMIDQVLKNNLTIVTDKTDVFDEKRTIGTYRLSLNQIEKGILGLGGRTESFPDQLKVEKIEPRLHFALVCAALSCPRLRNFAYRSETLEETLVQNSLMFFNSDIHIQTSGKSGKNDQVSVSSLFRWYSIDFDLLLGADTSSEARGNYAKSQVIEQCRDDKDAIVAEFAAKEFGQLSSITYNWTVNTQ